VPAHEQDGKHDDHDDNDDSDADKHGLLLSLSAGLTTVSQDGGRETLARQDGGPGWSVLEGVLDLGPGQFEVALGLVAAAFGLQARAVGGLSGGLLDAAFDCFGLVRNLLGDTHQGAAFHGLIPEARVR
jgi:hypothetical protein